MCVCMLCDRYMVYLYLIIIVLAALPQLFHSFGFLSLSPFLFCLVYKRTRSTCTVLYMGMCTVLYMCVCTVRVCVCG